MTRDVVPLERRPRDEPGDDGALVDLAQQPLRLMPSVGARRRGFDADRPLHPERPVVGCEERPPQLVHRLEQRVLELPRVPEVVVAVEDHSNGGATV